MDYFFLKLVHIISSTLLFGTGLGSAFYLYCADRSKDIQVIAFATRKVVVADWLFTTPAVIIQPLTGFALIHALHYPLTVHWLQLSILLFLVTGACWLPVVWLQIRLRDIVAQALLIDTSLPPLYHRYMRYWFWLGWPAFFAVIGIFYLMVCKPDF